MSRHIEDNDGNGGPAGATFDPVTAMIARGFDPELAARTIAAWNEGCNFPPDIPLEFISTSIGTRTVGEVTEFPDAYNEEKLYNPLHKRVEGEPTGFFFAQKCVIKYYHDCWYLNDAPPPPGSKPSGGGSKIVETVCMSDVEVEKVDWLWKDYLAKGKFQILAGIMGDGKSQITLEFAAAISRDGAKWPDGTLAPTGNVLIWSGEDNLEDTIKPRLMRMNADMSRIFAIIGVTEDGKKRAFDPATDMEAIEATIQKLGGIVLIIVDPVIAVAAGKGDSHKNVEMRAALQPLRDLAECHDSCVLGVTHFTKGTAGKDPRERVTASLAFGALARIVFATATRQGDGEGPPRLFTRAKNNLGPDGGGFGFEFNIGPLYDCPDIIVSRIKWLAPLNGTARDLLNEAEQAPNSDQRKKEKAAEIRAWLEAFVANGPRLKDEIEEVGVKLDYSVRQIRRARETLRLIVGSTGAFPRRTTWSLGAF